MAGLIAFIIIVIIAGISLTVQISGRVKDKSLFNKHQPESRHWAKILYFYGSQISAGRTKIKLSDSRIFEAWGKIKDIGFKQLDGAENGEYQRSFVKNNGEVFLKDKLILSEKVYEINIDKNSRIFQINSSRYTTQVNNLLLTSQTYREGELFCTRKELSPHYVEIIFNTDLVNSEELLVTSLIIMKERLTAGV
ncbi:MAG: hypothetical protein Q7K35_00825 [bacterium]|nr:hypothetical protein [bacterium]